MFFGGFCWFICMSFERKNEVGSVGEVERIWKKLREGNCDKIYCMKKFQIKIICIKKF